MHHYLDRDLLCRLCDFLLKVLLNFTSLQQLLDLLWEEYNR